MFEENGGEWAGCGEYKWSEGGSLMSVVAGGGGGCSAGGCIWVDDVDISGGVL